MQIFLLIALALPNFSLSDPIGDLDDLCEAPKFEIKSLPSNGGGSLEELKLLNDTEKSNPDLAKKVVASPGGYGHSELGIRYLARFFGYPAEYGEETKEKVEVWLANQEYNGSAMYEGTHLLWDKWVANTELRLEVPAGPYRDLPSNGDPKVFFKSPSSQAKFANCMRTEIAKKMCDNYMGNGRVLEEGDRVYFGKPNGRGFCHVKVPDWKKAREDREFKRLFDSPSENKTAR